MTTADLLKAINKNAPALGRKRYLCDVRRQLGMERAAFEQLVLSAWDAGKVGLSRADLVLDSRKVEDSEIAYLTETFHYVTA